MNMLQNIIDESKKYSCLIWKQEAYQAGASFGVGLGRREQRSIGDYYRARAEEADSLEKKVCGHKATIERLLENARLKDEEIRSLKVALDLSRGASARKDSENQSLLNQNADMQCAYEDQLNQANEKSKSLFVTNLELEEELRKLRFENAELRLKTANKNPRTDDRPAELLPDHIQIQIGGGKTFYYKSMEGQDPCVLALKIAKELEKKPITKNFPHGTILRTKDGRKVGNAVITGRCFSMKSVDDLYLIRTDVGNEVRVTDEEICEMFHTVYSYPHIK